MSIGRFSNSPPKTPNLLSFNTWKSDMYVPCNDLDLTEITDGCNRVINYKLSNLKDGCGEYYKQYDYDVLPVKDSSESDLSNLKKESGDNDRVPLTNSELDRLESKVLKNVSQELQTDSHPFSSLDSNIKFFKTTVEQIFETFYHSMQDFELYKKRFHDILERNKSHSISEMEEFIKEMIQHIMSSESVSNVSNNKSNSSYVLKERETNLSATECISSKSYEFLENIHSVVEAYKNDNYLTDSTNDDKNSKTKHTRRAGEIFNIYLQNNSPYVEIKMNDRNMLSEINIKDPNLNADTKVASAENLKLLAAKKKELECHDDQKPEKYSTDREIPIRVSSAKKNIHLDEDFTSEHEKNDKSLISRICNYICKRFRKNLY